MTIFALRQFCHKPSKRQICSLWHKLSMESFKIKMAPAVGFEPTTKWLTATYSTAELCRSVLMVLNIHHSLPISSAKMKKIVFFCVFYGFPVPVLFFFTKGKSVISLILQKSHCAQGRRCQKQMPILFSSLIRRIGTAFAVDVQWLSERTPVCENIRRIVCDQSVQDPDCGIGKTRPNRIYRLARQGAGGIRKCHQSFLHR